MKPAHTRTRPPPDPTVYPVEDEVGEEIIQRWICELLRPLLERFLASRGVRAFVGADQFVYWRKHDPSACVSPDLYVMPGAAPDAAVKVWKTWEDGVVPSFALEVVAEDRRKDYERAPQRHAELGTRELVVFDPHAAEAPGRVTWQVYRRGPRGGPRGELAQVLATDADRIESTSLGCFLRAVGEGPSLRVRVATGPTGDELFPTDRERADRAEAELAELRSELARRDGRS